MKLALRAVRRKPAFAAVAILTIALAIAANTALFSAVYAVLIQPLPFRDPSKLVQIWQTYPAIPQIQVTVPDYFDFRDRTRSFDQVAAHTISSMNAGTLLGQGEPELVHATMSSANLFSTMGIEPLLGRVLNSEDVRTKQHVAMISEKLWRGKFGASQAVIGSQMRLDSDSFQVIGVIPQRQAFPEWADLWIPLSLIEPDYQNRRKFHGLELIARLKPGVTEQQAQTEVASLARQLQQTYPDTNGVIGAYVIPLSRGLTQSIRPALLIAWFAVGLVLLIACANLAHLFMARMTERIPEMRIREALGAGTLRLISQVLSESLLIAAIGGGLGLVLGDWATQFLRRMAPDQLSRTDSAEAPVWIFALAISLISGILFGLPACWQLLRPRMRLEAPGRSIIHTGIHARSGLGSILIAGEVGLALLVLTGATLLTRSFAAILSEDPGFDARRVLTVPNLPLRADWDQSARFLANQLTPALRAIPGVQQVAAANSAPFSLGPTEQTRFATRFGLEGRSFDSGKFPVAVIHWVTSDYFSVLGIPLERGRALDRTDENQSRVVINQTMARRFFPDQDPVGKRVIMGVVDPQQTLYQIVGVVGDVREFGLDQPAEPAFYEISTGPVETLLIKTAAGSPEIAAAIRDAIRRADPNIPVAKIEPMEQSVADTLARRRFTLLLLTIFAGIAAFLTAAGIYGLLANSVNARVRELGVRAAVGANSRNLTAMILREAAIATLPGIVAGAALFLAFARLMQSLIYRISPFDPASLAIAAASLILLTFVAAWLPARRAASVDPAHALRTE